jgi:hypothetical protein
MPRPKAPTKKVRLNLELPEATMRAIHDLRDRLEAESVTETLRRAVDTYRTILSLTERPGARLFVREVDGTEREIVLL